MQIELYNENNERVAYVDDDGTIGGTEADLIEKGEMPEATITVTPITGTVKIYYDGKSWKKVTSYYDGEEPVWNDFNGAFIINRDYQFSLKFKDADGVESKVYTVLKKGAFLFHEDGTWVKLEDKGELPPYVKALSLDDEDEKIVEVTDETVMA